jgi:hypothetical protein
MEDRTLVETIDRLDEQLDRIVDLVEQIAGPRARDVACDVLEASDTMSGACGGPGFGRGRIASPAAGRGGDAADVTLWRRTTFLVADVRAGSEPMPEAMNDVCPICLKQFQTAYLAVENDGTVIVSEGWADKPVYRRYHVECEPDKA